MVKLRIKENVDLSKFTTFKIGGSARYFLEARSRQEVIGGIKWAQEKGLPFAILAGGSNLLVADKGFKGLVIQLSITNYQLRIKGKDIILDCGAGVKLSDLLSFSLREGLSGLEWASGIPQATVGGTIWGNAGAFGRTIGEIVKEVKATKIINYELSITNLKNKDCGFAYKDSVFKRDRGLVILSASLVLEKKNQEEVRQEIKRVLQYRKEHHPVEPSAGSIFKNCQLSIVNCQLLKKFPEMQQFEKIKAISARWLIEQVGLRGKKIGGAQISPKHANFIVNIGRAKASDVVALAKLAKEKVKNKFGITLEEEIQYLGF